LTAPLPLTYESFLRLLCWIIAAQKLFKGLP
jgi:hypothetical protein